MAYNLKLEIFRITLKQKGGSDFINFSSFFEKAFPQNNKEDSYKEFIKKYRSVFDSKFTLNADKNKGISVKESSQYNIHSNSNTIDTEIIGGATGIFQTLYKQDNSQSVKGEIDSDDIATLPYFIKIWTPFDHDSGVLMVQNYSNNTVTSLVKKHLSLLFQEYGYSLIISTYIPESVKDKYKNDSKVYKVAFVKESLSENKRSLINPLFTEFKDLKVRIEISGFKESIENFWAKFKGDEKIINSNLEDFDIKENEDFETIAYYEDSAGNKSHTSVRKDFDIKPTIFLSENLKISNSDHYDYEKMRNHTNEILEKIKIEIGYTRNNAS